MFLKSTFTDIWNDFWDYMSDTYFNITLDQYENFGLSPTATTLSVIIFGLFFGIFFAAIFAMLNKNYAGIPVRALLKQNAIGKENALTFSELTLKKRLFARYALRQNVVVRKIVACIPLSERESMREKPQKKPKPSEDKGSNAEGSEDAPEECMLRDLPRNFDLENTALYIPERLKYAAEFRFDAKGTSWKWVIVTILVFFGLVFLLLRFLPEFFQFLDNLIGVITG